MEHSQAFDPGANSYDLEQQLALAERRYAEARTQSRKLRDECHALEAEIDARDEVVRRLRERYDAADAKCQRLKRQIEELEEKLDA